jgi:UDP-sugar diphosphatase
MVGEMLPSLDIVLKDRNGNPVDQDNLDSLVVKVDGQELKVWAAVLEYAASQPVGESGLPEADSYYATTSGRINPQWTVPYLFWLLLMLAVIVFLIALLVRRIKRKREMNVR